MITEGTFGECTYADACTLTGAKTRTDSVCRNGVAVDEAATVEDGCERTPAETDGVIVTSGTFGECAYADVCTFTGQRRAPIAYVVMVLLLMKPYRLRTAVSEPLRKLMAQSSPPERSVNVPMLMPAP